MPGAGLPSGSASAPANMVANDADNTLADGVDIAVGSTTGTMIGTASTQKLAFYGETPVVQGLAVSPAVGGGTIDAQARTAIDAIIARLAAVGITA
jgi:hypothetical protein